MQTCPNCKSKDIHRSRARSRWEHWRKNFTGKRPFRCRACTWRGWAVDPGPIFTEAEIERATRAIAPEPPNLRGTPLMPRAFAATLDLDMLDKVGLKEKA
jgi:hypothetical protein